MKLKGRIGTDWTGKKIISRNSLQKILIQRKKKYFTLNYTLPCNFIFKHISS